MDQSVSALIAIIGIIVGLAIAYGKAFGGYQTDITQAVIDAAKVPTRYRRLLNLVVGIAIATAFTLVGAAWMGQLELVPAGILAGVLASVEAGKVHDAEKMAPE
ncbi:MAG TPA: hypothetical protein VNZ57_10675 [Longimicrobiales bacterium]|nr:hypothetical protein [Longimicrobiales bacterium]